MLGLTTKTTGQLVQAQVIDTDKISAILRSILGKKFGRELKATQTGGFGGHG